MGLLLPDNIEQSFNGPIVQSNFEKEHFDLVFTMGVLIHIHPDDLLTNMQKMFDYSSRYILVSEYFNRTPVMIEYHGKRINCLKEISANISWRTFLCNW
jgi:2-polyprenyl-3-methyl-5-hydroxy-6-metoxy-1,4-benzoquinol methylase